jgi:hypothetical protein
MSPRERTAWISTGATLTIWGYYFTAFWLDVAATSLDGQQVLWRFIGCMVVYAVVVIGINLATGVMTRQNLDRPLDEMERQFEGSGDRIGFRVLELLIPVALIPGLLLTPAIASAFPGDPAGATALIFTNGVLLVVVVTEMVRELVTIISFRMTA